MAFLVPTVIDGDSREMRLSRWLGAGAEHGIVDAALQGKPLDECVLYDSRSNLSLLPMTTAGDRVVEPSQPRAVDVLDAG